MIEFKYPFTSDIRSAQIVVPCKDLDRALEFFTNDLGFRLEMIFPADEPQTAVVSGFGTTLRLEKSSNVVPVTLHLTGDFGDQKIRDLNAPDGLRIIFRDENEQVEFSPYTPEFLVSKFKNEWHTGRAGMLYRDLLPNRLGGRIIASHIRIEKGGAVPDYVHFHKIDFQMIYCLAGRARLVYEDQGAPFWMQAGDLVLQPPEIRHRVLECSDGFEVLETSAPAMHPTFAEHRIVLPNAEFNPQRVFGGQRFLHHRAENAVWTRGGAVEICDTGVSSVTGGKFEAQVWRALSPSEVSCDHSGQFAFFYVMNGALNLTDDKNANVRLEKNDCFLLPTGQECSPVFEKGLELVRVSA